MNRIKFSLIISIDHGDKNYVDLIHQAQHQDYINLEIIVVSNRLDPKDHFIIEFLVNQDKSSRCRHISMVTRGCPAVVFNQGISCATGDYIWCIDNQVLIKDKSTIKKIVDQLVQSKAQTMFLVDISQSKTINGPEVISKSDDIELENPISLLNKDDWINTNRLIMNLGSIRLFNIHFIEGWSHKHGALFCIQIIRFIPNIYYFTQDLVEYESIDIQGKSNQLIDYILSLGYILRYTEMVFGVSSRVLKLVLKREVKDNAQIVELINASSLNQPIKDFLNFSRSILFKYYIKTLFEKSDNFYEKILLFQKAGEDIQCTPMQMLNEFFKYSKIKIHCGAHKTATTYIQSILFNARHDLALQNIVYIHHEKFRDDITNAKFENINNIDDKIAYSIIKQASLLSYKQPNVLLISEENLIRPHSDISSKWISRSTFQSASNYSCACMRNGYNLDHLNIISKIFKGGVEIIYVVRNYLDYLLSRHSEFLKWRSFKEFDDEFVTSYDLNKCSWQYLISELKNISHITTVVAFEDYKNDPLLFANYLASYDLSMYITKMEIHQKISRSRASQVLLDELIDKKNLGFDPVQLKNIFNDNIDIVDDPKFASKIIPNYLVENLKSQYSLNYLNTSPNLFNYPHLSLAEQQSSENNFLACLPLPEKSQQSFKRDSHELKDCLGYINQRSLYLDNRNNENLLSQGISAMIRIKNEERNIYNVLRSIKNCFDEIVIIDNNSTDNTIQEINRAKSDFPSLKDKLKLRHYKFEIAKCGFENFNTPQNSPHSLASFYNYSLKQCSFSTICKWDGDMFLPKSMAPSFQAFLNQIQIFTPPNCDNTVFGLMKGLTVYKGSDHKFYSRGANFEIETRIFENIPGVFYIKEILWEHLFSLHKIERVISEQVTFVEYKDTSVNEFAHWSIEASLGLSPRKSKEIRDFNLIKNITDNSNALQVKEALKFHGFEEINFDLFDFED